MYQGMTVANFATELVRQNDPQVKRDFSANTRQMHVENGTLHFANYAFPINNIAAQQISTFTNIPATYYNRMRDENPALLDMNINSWFEKMKPAQRTIRVLDNRARAFLSDRYMPIDNHDIAIRVLDVLKNMVPLTNENVSCDITERRMYLKVINYAVQGEVVPGDIVHAGLIITNSEVGQGMVSIKPFIHRLVCRNGAVIDLAVRKRRHVGRTIELTEGTDYEIFRAETLEADKKAFMMKVEDTVSNVMNDVQFDKILDYMRESKDKKFTTDNIPAVVELAAKKYGIPETATDNILTHLIAEGDPSVYGLANAVTRYSQDVDNYDTASELEEIGGKMFTMTDSDFRELNNATHTKAQKRQERKQQRERHRELIAA